MSITLAPTAVSKATPVAAEPFVSSRRVRVARRLMTVAAVSAALSAVSAIAVIADASPQTQMVETWRGYGYLVFAGLFALLAARPTYYRGVWEVALLHKMALTVTAITYSVVGTAEGTSSIIVWDGALSVVVGAAYIACRGWTARPARLS